MGCLRAAPAVTFLAVVCFLGPAIAEAQQPCTYSISLTGDIGDLGDDSILSYVSSGGSSRVRLITSPECPWMAESSAAFLTLAATTGVGTRDVVFSVAPNFTARPRTARIRIADQSVTVTQGRGIPIVDFNRDGHFDFFWHNRADGRLSTWLMNRDQLFMGVLFTTSQVADTSWELVGSGDLNGDQHADLVWQNKIDGRISAWLMAGLQKIDAALLSIPQVPDLEWRIRAVTDADGDGRADIFWQHQTQGLVAVWRMNGFNVLDGSLIQAPMITDPAWRLVGVGAASADDSITLHWQHDSDGRLAIWFVSQMRLMHGGWTGMTVPDTHWKIHAMGDVDRDGTNDYIWRHDGDGRMSVCLRRYMDDTIELGAVPDLNWQLVGPR